MEEGSYYSESVHIAKKLGIVKGTGDNRFDLAVAISRQDMMTMTAMVLNVSGKKLLESAVGDIHMPTGGYPFAGIFITRF